MDTYLQDISRTPFSIVYVIDDPNDKLSIFNELILKCVNDHAPLIRTKFTRPPAPWMRNTEVIVKRNEVNQLRQVMDVDKDAYRKCRNEYKKTLRESKKNFVKKSLSSRDL